MFMNNKGQAFSVFKLLIAAVVAIFILTILLQILGGIGGFQQGKPGESATSTIKTLVNNLYTPEETSAVTWSSGTVLNAKTIAMGTGQLTDEQVCLSLGDYVDDAEKRGFQILGTENNIIKYNRTQDFVSKLTILCAYGTDLEETLSDLEYEWAGTVGDCSTCVESEDRCCVVAITRNA